MAPTDLSWVRPYEPPITVWAPKPTEQIYQLVGDESLPIATHWIGRSRICADADSCPACRDGVQRRVTLYMWARKPGGEPGILTLPHQCGIGLPVFKNFYCSILKVRQLNKYRVSADVAGTAKPPGDAPIDTVLLLDAIARIHGLIRHGKGAGAVDVVEYAAQLRAHAIGTLNASYAALKGTT